VRGRGCTDEGAGQACAHSDFGRLGPGFCLATAHCPLSTDEWPYNPRVHARFYAPDLAGDLSPVALPEEEARHLTRVLRLGAGDEVTVFDGHGHQWLARVEHASRGRVIVRPLRAVAPAPEPSVTVTLAQAVLKADLMDEVVRNLTMLGVAAVQPVVSERTEIGIPTLMRGRRIDRWRRVAIASAKQSGRAVVPDIRAPLGFAELVAEDRAGPRFMLVEPRAAGGSRLPAAVLGEEGKPTSATVLVGPEGGWTPGEIAFAERAGFGLLTLGQRTLRADAAPLVALSVLQFLWGDL